MHDIVIRGGTIVDGTGAPATVGDVAIDGDRIVAVGGSAGPARRDVRADGRLVTPGFVDVHTHYDGQATWDSEMAPSCFHGVTTIVMGNCGVGFAPVRPDRHEWLIQVMEGVEDIPGTALAEGIPWGWESFGEYMDALAARPRTLDIGAQVTHGCLRAYVMGDRGAENAPATADELERMAALVDEGMRAGALGFTTSRANVHRTSTGEHIPGYGVATDEVTAICRGLTRAGRGAIGVNTDFLDVDDEIAWLRHLRRETGRPVWFLLAQMDDEPAKWRRIMAGVDRAVAEGEPLLAQVAGRPIGFLMGLESTLHPFISRPTYKAIRNRPHAERVAAMRDPGFRAAVLSEQVSHRSEIMRTVTQDWHKMFRLGDPPDYEPAPETSIAALAKRDGRDPAAVCYDMLLELDGRQLLFMPALNYASGDHSEILAMLEHPQTVLGLSDGGAHCGLICDASTPSYMLSHWSRDRTRGPKLPLERVVRQQTAETAAFYGLMDRGVLRPGARADLNVIDFDRLNLGMPQMVRDLPAGGRRLMQRASGFAMTMVAGTPTLEDDTLTGATPGRLVRGPQAA